jgi:hypothetical protein
MMIPDWCPLLPELVRLGLLHAQEQDGKTGFRVTELGGRVFRCLLVTQADAENRDAWLVCALRGMGKPWW